MEDVVAMFENFGPESEEDKVSSAKQYTRKRHADTYIDDIIEHMDSLGLNQK